ncbi:uncharacterized protein B0I36DRAFT_362980 [Microdochium trichocladiopsis]|uniref:Uncharacterized protein n=1 Tax=Microdochium trichocladiopsis TaxID=1682393 RepID=A0A9P8Y970_9PEZI|nr:uncharacterized protein B0I36DRAFT_362980 [Microdochium trichocladiopsis]KAH7031266.1 hypothetical protein B0I36DRAFT_362980 [Microdochium trichocladiopsis]
MTSTNEPTHLDKAQPHPPPESCDWRPDSPEPVEDDLGQECLENQKPAEHCEWLPDPPEGEIDEIGPHWLPVQEALPTSVAGEQSNGKPQTEEISPTSSPHVDKAVLLLPEPEPDFNVLESEQPRRKQTPAERDREKRQKAELKQMHARTQAHINAGREKAKKETKEMEKRERKEREQRRSQESLEKKLKRKEQKEAARHQKAILREHKKHERHERKVREHREKERKNNHVGGLDAAQDVMLPGITAAVPVYEEHPLTRDVEEHALDGPRDQVDEDVSPSGGTRRLFGGGDMASWTPGFIRMIHAEELGLSCTCAQEDVRVYAGLESLPFSPPSSPARAESCLGTLATRPRCKITPQNSW